jgi:hypothetical protein
MNLNEKPKEPEHVIRLREIVKAPESEWRQKLFGLMAAISDVMQIQELKTFIEEHLPDKKSQFHNRMSEMATILAEKIRLFGSDQRVLQSMVSDIVNTQQQISQLTQKLQSAKAALAEMLGAGAKKSVGKYWVGIGFPKLFVRVENKEEIPKQFYSAQPDKKMILNHFKSTGEMVSGILVKEYRPSVVIKEFENF